mmetsp:Transcript_34460/g.78626  ORF Transcript_34460/g.78626 Transcript_34460/m.78626 type:complete len:382 (+) Transcript_34460:133-1278(+)
MNGIHMPYASQEERTLLRSRNFSFRPLASAGQLSVLKIIQTSILPFLVFAFTLMITCNVFRYKNNDLMCVLYYVGLAILMAYPTLAFFTLIAGIVATKFASRVRWSAVVFWMWWPTWKFVLCVIACGLGTSIGSGLWYNNFLPYHEVSRLQSYGDVDPWRTSGDRVQDVGLAMFNESAGVDRVRSGCFKNAETYCIAPIVHGGSVPLVDKVIPPEGAYDFFMAGINCCGCPVSEFRCGSWDSPRALGGVRVMDATETQFYRLAAQDWASTYGKELRRPLFFRWVENARDHWVDLHDRGVNEEVLSLAAVAFSIPVICFLLNVILKLLCDNEFAAPLDAPVPGGGIGRLFLRHTLPEIHHHYTNSKAQTTLGLSTDPKYVIL